VSEGNSSGTTDKKHFLNPMNITETSRKDKVITSACELVDQQEVDIKDLTGKKNTLTFLKTRQYIRLADPSTKFPLQDM